MDEKAYNSFLRENIVILIRAHLRSIKICNSNSDCCSCPFYDEKMENSYGERCFSMLLSNYAAKLTQAAKDIEEKGE